jgi:CBS domain-containing protein
MSVKAILQSKGSDILSVSGDTSVGDAVAMLAKHRIGAVPVLNEGDVVGIFSERDVVYCLAKEGQAALQRAVREVMTAPAVTVESSLAVLGALSLMTRRRIRHLPVVDSGKLIGFVSIGDLVKHRIEKIEAEAEAMRSYIQSA